MHFISEEKFDVVDVLKAKKEGWLDDFIKDLTKASVAKQLTVGGLTGWSVALLGLHLHKTSTFAFYIDKIIFEGVLDICALRLGVLRLQLSVAACF